MNYGDCGKGLAVDYLSTPDTLVVRYNSGAQAGHTVTTPDGKRHVFHHIGSGTFKGAKTFLSKFFVLNPIAFCDEMYRLSWVRDMIIADPQCPITTPYDIMLNKAAEKNRGEKRHGSCGWGFNETLVRSATFPFQPKDLGISMSSSDWDFYKTKEHIKNILKNIRDCYVPLRAKELGTELDSMPYLFNDNIVEQYVQDVLMMSKYMKWSSWEEISHLWTGDIIFEGAQGLQLDMDNWQFPHVTHSKTGLHNILQLICDGQIKDPLEAYYVTRTYLTRHGAGPMPHNHALDFVDIVDTTNVENENQGKMRYTWLDLDYIRNELSKEIKHCLISFNMIMTCVDQLKDSTVKYIQNQTDQKSTAKELIQAMKREFFFEKTLMSTGVTHKDVDFCE